MVRKKSNFETSLRDLEEVVNQLEKGDLSLEESLKAFEKGVSLTQACQKSLDEAEQKIDQLTGDINSPELKEFKEK